MCLGAFIDDDTGISCLSPPIRTYETSGIVFALPTIWRTPNRCFLDLNERESPTMHAPAAHKPYVRQVSEPMLHLFIAVPPNHCTFFWSFFWITMYIIYLSRSIRRLKLVTALTEELCSLYELTCPNTRDITVYRRQHMAVSWL